MIGKNEHLVMLVKNAIQRVEDRKAEIVHITRRSNQAYAGIKETLADLEPIVAEHSHVVYLEVIELAGPLQLIVRRAGDSERWHASIGPQLYTHINDQVGGVGHGGIVL